MSAPPTDVVDRLERLGALAPATGVDPDRLWARGRRRQRRWTGVVLAGVAVLGLLGTSVTPALVERAQRVEPAVSDERMVLPDVIRQPGGWEPALPRIPGRLSAVGLGSRSGLWSERHAWWGVSAATGQSRFLELPGAADTVDGPALSADGWRLAYWATGEVAGEPLSMSGPTDDPAAVVGVAVLDLRTGAHDLWAVESEHGLAPSGLAWSGDVLWWVAGPIERVSDTATRTRDVAVRTWDVTTDERDAPTGPSARVSAHDVGDAPGGFVEQRRAGRVTRVVGGAEPTTLRITLSEELPDAAGITSPSMSTDGTRLAALLEPDTSFVDDAPKAVLVGTVSGRDVDLRPLAGVQEQWIAGWRSPTALVVLANAHVEDGHPPRALRAYSFDVATGERDLLLDYRGSMPSMAAEAWGAEVVPAPDAPLAPDPRLVGTALLALALGLWRVGARVRRRRGGA